jgi:hypothetical protein
MIPLSATILFVVIKKQGNEEMTILVQPFDTLDGDPARYVEYLRDCWRSAAMNLNRPVQQWATGDSHSMSREIQRLCEEYAQGMAIEYGVFDAHGKLTGYAR